MTLTNYAHPTQHGCTGLTARWCSNHGDCICLPQEELPSGESEHMNTPDCPLHGDDRHLPALETFVAAQLAHSNRHGEEAK